jgi:uncharacterized protein YdhG (YjbR/CyaY superfamily)
MQTKTIPKTVDEYILSFPKEIQDRLSLLRSTIVEVAPEVEEGISYQIPAYTLHGVLVYFAGFAKHIGFYSTPTGHTSFVKQLEKYKTGKGSVQFPHTEKLPIALVKKMVQFRVKENKKKWLAKQKVKPKT